MHDEVVALADWQNFYVITGSAAAGLMGLTFVVIAIAANARRTSATGLRAFVTPTAVHFGTVLVLAAFMSAPHQNATSLGVGFATVGMAGLFYGAVTALSLRRLGTYYVPVGEDWLWHAGLPTIIYAALLGLAFVTRSRTELSLYGVAGASVLLLFIGVHNAWDVAVSISMRQQDPPEATPKD